MPDEFSTEKSIDTSRVKLEAGWDGTVIAAHGFSPKPDSIITNSLEDSKDEQGPYAFGISTFDEKNVYGSIYVRETGEQAFDATLDVELGAIYFG